MSSFSQLCQDVMTLTNRPELVSETELAVRHATQYFHMIDFWQRDAVEEVKQFAAPSFTFQLHIPAEFDRFRKIRYIKKFDLETLTPFEGEEHQIKEVGPDYLFDRYGRAKGNVYYIAGEKLNIKLGVQCQGLLISWYTYPNVAPESYSSWIADMMPHVIVTKAVGDIHMNIGMADEANRRLRRSEDPYDSPDCRLVRINDIEASAR